jgi:NTP pyrophosphatase (non-canonical NTP hydrolase)
MRSARLTSFSTKRKTEDGDPVTMANDFRDSIALIDEWLDGAVAERYQRESLAQDWARVAKVAEEAGEAIEALISWTGQNPRKPQRPEALDELLEELADVACTGLLAMQHFIKDADVTQERFEQRLARLRQRAEDAMREAA